MVALFIGMPAATAVSITSDTVTAYGWNSCGGWFKTGGTFANYCPFCGGHGCLRYNPKHTYEGEWTCSRCDADFCLCGRCKAGGSGVYLKKVVAKKSLSNTSVGITIIQHFTGKSDTRLSMLKSELNTNWSILK